MREDGFSRRNFLKAAGAVTAITAVGGFPAELFAYERRMARFPEKTDLILLTSRPPQLETPLSYFKEMVTPNEALFVRWHIANVPTSVDLNEWRLKVGGNTEKELSLSMDDLKKFEKVTFTAVIQCSGNARSFFVPPVAGGEWGDGAMGNVTWTGARLRDILNSAGLKAGTVDVSFNGLDKPPLPTVPDFVKSLPVDKALEEDLIVAYEMNGKPLTMLNGFPARLILPGWYATYWVKSLADITALSKPFEGFWVKTAYRIPETDCGCIPPGTSPKKTIPINRMTTRSLIIDPASSSELTLNRPATVMGVAFSGGRGIQDVLVSVDGGRRWEEARLGEDKGKYSWRQFFYDWRPAKPGKYTLMAKATDTIGESQPFEGLWNPAGYLWNKVEKTEVVVKYEKPMKKFIIVSIMLAVAGLAYAAEKSTVHSIEIPVVKTELKAGEGRDVTERYCSICHSLDYIIMQPKFPKAKWAGVVNKMIKVMGAPIPEADAKVIIDYLAAQYGMGD